VVCVAALAGLALPAARAEDFSGAPAVTVAEARAELKGVHARVDAWSDAERVAAWEAAEVLLVSCPFNRTAAQLPQALLQAVGTVEGRGLSAAQSAELRRLKDGLALHRALVDRATGGALPAPGVVDHLDSLDARLLPSRGALAGDAEPIARTKALVDAIPDVVADMPPDVSGRIADASERLARLTASRPTRDGELLPDELLPDDAWPFARLNQGWLNGLAALLPHLSDPEERRRVAEAVELLDVYLKSRC
jgi:hypothetical protein